MKILNLYAGLGGNRLLWDNCEVTAIELNEEIANLYKIRFPKDKVIITDAHKFLIENFKNFDFIWSSPPCPSHSRARFWGYGKKLPIYPDLKLYEEIIFLQNHSKVNQFWVIENVIPYYDTLLQGNKIGRHIFWSNFNLNIDVKNDDTGKLIIKSSIKELLIKHSLNDFKVSKNINKLQVLRNLVDYNLSKEIYQIMKKSFKN